MPAPGRDPGWVPVFARDHAPGITGGKQMPTIQADRLKKIGVALLRAAGASDEEAEAVAGGCVEANLVGHDSHGIVAIPTYIDRVKAGHIVPGAPFTIVQESPTDRKSTRLNSSHIP